MDIQKRVIVKCFLCEKEGVTTHLKGTLYLLPAKWRAGVATQGEDTETTTETFSMFMLCGKCAEIKEVIN